MCFNCNQPGHYIQQCPCPHRKPDQLRAAHTELPHESGDEEDRKDADDSASMGCQDDMTDASNSEGEPEDLIKFEIDDDGQSSDGERLHAMSDALEKPSGEIRNIKFHKVTVEL